MRLMCSALMAAWMVLFGSQTQAQIESTAEVPSQSSGYWVQDFKNVVARCWNPPEDVDDKMVIQFALDKSGRVSGDILLVEPTDPNAAEELSFEAGRRAILRCQGADGFDLPVSEYHKWELVILAFSSDEGVTSSSEERAQAIPDDVQIRPQVRPVDEKIEQDANP